MKIRIFLITALACLFWFAMDPSPTQGQKEYHGADSVFEKEGMVILWAILKGSTEETSWVYIKILQPEGGQIPFSIFGVEAVDPFSKAKEWIVKGKTLNNPQMIRSIRASFREKIGRRISFYQNKEEYQADKPAMAVFYLGVPDTSPELLSEKEVEDYFEKAIQRLKKP
jgi:hypothetical protein